VYAITIKMNGIHKTVTNGSYFIHQRFISSRRVAYPVTWPYKHETELTQPSSSD